MKIFTFEWVEHLWRDSLKRSRVTHSEVQLRTTPPSTFTLHPAFAPRSTIMLVFFKLPNNFPYIVLGKSEKHHFIASSGLDRHFLPPT
jgi:hypothetical protein